MTSNSNKGKQISSFNFFFFHSCSLWLYSLVIFPSPYGFKAHSNTRIQYEMFTLTPCLCKMFGSNSFQCQHFQCVTITTQRNSISPGCYAQCSVASYTRYHQCGNGNQCQTNLLFVWRYLKKMKMK